MPGDHPPPAGTHPGYKYTPWPPCCIFYEPRCLFLGQQESHLGYKSPLVIMQGGNKGGGGGGPSRAVFWFRPCLDDLK